MVFTIFNGNPPAVHSRGRFVARICVLYGWGCTKKSLAGTGGFLGGGPALCGLTRKTAGVDLGNEIGGHVIFAYGIGGKIGLRPLRRLHKTPGGGC